ncbi:heme oxygenase-like protein [Biscogniauxia mediterranea]|nr:heme oxygenase-like protein [Biscogniauxia mediterranea]
MPSETPETTRSLADSINIAIRPVHTKLNKLVIYRLPLALPPKADDASQYVSGLLHITPIYMTFESLWQDILDSPASLSEDQNLDQNNNESSNASFRSSFSSFPPSPPLSSSPGTTTPTTTSDIHSRGLPSSSLDPPHPPAVCCPRIHALLAHLRLPGLARSRALRADLLALTGWSERTLREQLGHAASSPALGSFLSHARAETRRRPHVLVAYAWVLYMALFSGGRFIRASLEAVDPAFWVPASALPHGDPLPGQEKAKGKESAYGGFLPAGFLAKAVEAALGTRITSTAVSSAAATTGRDTDIDPRTDEEQKRRENLEQQWQQKLPVRFLRFDTPSDGEDLKTTFKQRLAESEDALLTPGERDDIVREAQHIFDFMVQIVGELDEVCGSTDGKEGGDGGEDEARLLSLRSRDSVVVEKEREKRKIAKMAVRAATEMEKRAEREKIAKRAATEMGDGAETGKGKGKEKEGSVRFK